MDSHAKPKCTIFAVAYASGFRPDALGRHASAIEQATLRSLCSPKQVVGPDIGESPGGVSELCGHTRRPYDPASISGEWR